MATKHIVIRIRLTPNIACTAVSVLHCEKEELQEQIVEVAPSRLHTRQLS
jgi:hypothetical protein